MDKNRQRCVRVRSNSLILWCVQDGGVYVSLLFLSNTTTTCNYYFHLINFCRENKETVVREREFIAAITEERTGTHSFHRTLNVTLNG